MSIHEDLTVGCHQQDTGYYCGAACAQMVLEQLGAGLLDQDSLYNDNHSHSVIEPSWYTAPDGLQWTMNNRKPATFPNSFVPFALDSEDAISRKIVWTIHHYQVAPIALVYGWAHWIVVRGYDADVAPNGADDTTFSISGLFINNPWPPTPATPPPPPHTATDGCGTGGDRGIADEHIAYVTWQDTYMTGVPNGFWKGKYVAVCDPEPPADRVGKQSRPKQTDNGERLLTPEKAVERALAGMREYKLLDREPWKSDLANTRPGDASLVQRLDRPDSFYYVVPFRSNARLARALVCVDARFGNYRQAVAVPDRSHNALHGLNFSSATALQRVIGQKINLGGRKGRIVVRKEAHSLYPTLVWKPCRESLSPYFPFFLITVGNERLYIRVDGQIFTKLHDRDRGI